MFYVRNKFENNNCVYGLLLKMRSAINFELRVCTDVVDKMVCLQHFFLQQTLFVLKFYRYGKVSPQ